MKICQEAEHEMQVSCLWNMKIVLIFHQSSILDDNPPEPLPFIS